MKPKETELLPYVRWTGSLTHDVFSKIGLIVRTACGLKKSLLNNLAFTDVKPGKGRHCWNCRVATGDVKPQLPAEVKVVKP